MIKGGPSQVVKKDVRRIGLFVSWFQADGLEERSALSNEDSVSLEFQSFIHFPIAKRYLHLLTDRY